MSIIPINSNHPIALLPLKLETRFMKVNKNESLSSVKEAVDNIEESIALVTKNMLDFSMGLTSNLENVETQQKEHLIDTARLLTNARIHLKNKKEKWEHNEIKLAEMELDVQVEIKKQFAAKLKLSESFDRQTKKTEEVIKSLAAAFKSQLKKDKETEKSNRLAKNTKVALGIRMDQIHELYNALESNKDHNQALKALKSLYTTVKYLLSKVDREDNIYDKEYLRIRNEWQLIVDKSMAIVDWMNQTVGYQLKLDYRLLRDASKLKKIETVVRKYDSQLRSLLSDKYKMVQSLVKQMNHQKESIKAAEYAFDEYVESVKKIEKRVHELKERFPEIVVEEMNKRKAVVIEKFNKINALTSNKKSLELSEEEVLKEAKGAKEMEGLDLSPLSIKPQKELSQVSLANLEEYEKFANEVLDNKGKSSINLTDETLLNIDKTRQLLGEKEFEVVDFQVNNEKTNELLQGYLDFGNQSTQFMLAPTGTGANVPVIPWPPTVVGDLDRIDFTFQVSQDANNHYKVDFQNTSWSAHGISDLKWYFDDGTVVQGLQYGTTSHTYATPNPLQTISFVVRLFVYINGGWKGTVKQVIIDPPTNSGGNSSGSGSNTNPWNIDPDVDYQLWIRAYPDEIAINQHDPELSQLEVDAGTIYWREIVKANGEFKKMVAGWNALRKRFGHYRAAWVAKKMKPTGIPTQADPDITLADYTIDSISLVTLSDDALSDGVKFWEKISESKENKATEENAWNDLLTKYTEEEAEQIIFLAKKVEEDNEVNKDSEELDLTVEKKRGKALSIDKREKLDSSLVKDDLVSISDDLTKSDGLVFPVYSVRSDESSRAATTAVLPNELKFIVKKRDGSKYEKFGLPIPAVLTTGIGTDQQSAFTHTAEHELNVPEDVKWMFDFEEAVLKGMAVKIDIDGAEAMAENPDAGFESVIVVGAKSNVTAATSKTLMENLFEQHHYSSRGMEFLKTGTPTNNTGTGDSGYKPGGPDEEEGFKVEQGGALNSSSVANINKLFKRNGDVLAAKLGIDPKVFNHIQHSDLTETSDAVLANAAWYNATFGYFLEEMLYNNNPDFGQLLDSNTKDQLRDFFIYHVSGRGNIPTIRIKKQPYGFLPITNYTNKTRDPLNLDLSFNGVLEDVLIHRLWKGFELPAEWDDINSASGTRIPNSSVNTMATAPHIKSGKWAQLITENTATVDSPLTSGTPLAESQQRFLNLLGLLPRSSNFYHRNGFGIEARNTQSSVVFPNIDNGNGITTTFDTDLFFNLFDFFEGYQDISVLKDVYTNPGGYKDYYHFVEGLQISRTMYGTQTTDLQNLIDDKVPTNNRFLDIISDDKNYLQLLLTKSPDEILTTIKDGTEPSKSILYNLSRQSILMSYWDAGMRCWEKSNLVDGLYSEHYRDYIAYGQGVNNSNHFSGSTFSGYTDYLFLLLDHYNLTVNTQNIQRLLTDAWRQVKYNNHILDLFPTTVQQDPVAGAGGTFLALTPDQAKILAQQFFIDWNTIPNHLNPIIQSTRNYLLPSSSYTYSTTNSTPYRIMSHVLRLYSQSDIITSWPDLQSIPLKPYLRSVFQKDRYRSFVKSIKQEITNSTRPHATTPPFLKPPPYFFFDRTLELNPPNGVVPPRETLDLYNNLEFASRLDFLEMENHSILGMPSGIKMGDYLHQSVLSPYTPDGLKSFYERRFLRNTRAAIDALAKKSTGDLERLMAEHLDLCSYRLDAWITGLTDAKLEALQQQENSETFIGAYGLLNDLKPGGTRLDENNEAIAFDVDQTGESPIAIDPENQGFIHAPSIKHALSAAVLRSAYISTEADVYKVNLSSNRVRKAKQYIEAIQNGATLSSLLGYDFERALHDINPALALYISDLRQVFPIQANRLEDAANSQNAAIHLIEARNVVDGLELLDAYREDPLFLNSISTIPADEHNHIINAILILDDALDGLADLAISEGVFQAAGGNFGKAGSMLKALSDGNRIPDPEIVNTPKRYKNIRHHVGVFMDPALAGWATGTPSPRRQMEPAIDSWLSERLGNPNNLKFHYSIEIDTGTGTLTQHQGITSVQDLNINAIDFVYSFAKNQTNNDEIEKILKLHFAKLNNAILGECLFDFETRDLSWGEEVKTLNEIRAYAHSLYKTISSGRALLPLDLELTAEAPSVPNDGIDFTELMTRTNALVQYFITTKQALDSCYTVGNTASQATIENTLNELNGFGISDFIIVPSVNSTASQIEDNVTQAKRVMETRMLKLQQAQSEIVDISKFTPKQHFEKIQAVAQAIFGKGFVICPQFKVLNPTEILQGLSHSSAMLPASNPMAMDDWLHGVGRVRQRMATVENSILLADVFSEELELIPIQLPIISNEDWLGIEFDPAKVDLTQDRLSFVGLYPDGFDPNTKSYAGILIDEWNELIPEKEETTGIAFHYDQPNAKAPQTVLLAVHSDVNSGNSWSYEELEGVVETTRDLMKLRAVEPDHILGSNLKALKLVLPGVVGRIDSDNTEIAVDFGVSLPPAVPVVIPSDDDGDTNVDNSDISIGNSGVTVDSDKTDLTLNKLENNSIKEKK